MSSDDNQGRIIIFSAPSGAGKSTIIRHLLGVFPRLELSVSATSRPPRGEERDGVNYHFLSPEQFRQGVERGDFVEWEEVYNGAFYGTLHSELERIHRCGHIIVFDIDVKGGVRLKRLFGEQALSIFIMPPSVETLRERLVRRGEDSLGDIDERVAKACAEIAVAPQFDCVLCNDSLADALSAAEKVVSEFIERD
ncbi:guanylate kinase [Bacteroidia bacterium]|nr:guanylate kinase [Bacteroidia bacterium]